MLDPANEARLEEILNGFEKQRDSVLALQADLAQATKTVRSPDKSMSVTFSAGGGITDVTFHNTKYKQMSPKELGRIVLQTVGQAMLQLQQEAMATMQPMLAETAGFAPGGVNPFDLLGGTEGANGDLMRMIGGGLEDVMRKMTENLAEVTGPATAKQAPSAGPASKPAAGAKSRTTRAAAPKRGASALDDDEA
ncbi:YbaB/EbfC family nucleoid-associated protein [Streptomyces sp. NPDC001941]|uniref:YbaB/EbfC family nucleoid-associated protein n=1 Tax=Streptomyces sp. NPDC001941 TaxID=3154659 RepID=UPI003318D65B